MMRTIPATSNAIDLQAAQWIERRSDDAWSAADQAEFDSWLAASPANRVAYLRLDDGWRRTERLAELPPRVARFFPVTNVPAAAFKLAAAFTAVAMLGAAVAYLVLRPTERIYSTPVGGHETVAFADGSKIELNTDTVLRARMTTGERVVWLEKGEAYFQVKHDPAHPFVVMAGERRITDLGTKFLVRRDSARFEVAVLQGRVWFDASGKPTSAQATLLSQGDDAVATAGSISVTRKSLQKLSNQLGWRQGMLVFSHATLALAASEFNRYNAKKIVFADANASQRIIGGSFPATDVDAFTNAVQIAFGLHVENRSNEIVISR